MKHSLSPGGDERRFFFAADQKNLAPASRQMQ
jgi:hypothetical protein